YKFDLQKAKELLKTSGAPDKLKLRLAYLNTNKTHQSMGLYIQQALKGIGVNVELIPLDSNPMSQRSLDMNKNCL
ncbi:ABC transporter substrate-binding protein, partial [Enterobacter asburiae]